ncbi:hypothetical protein SDC9_61316 [bioreactor metagenome]|uniref:Uncharacterized protein n=1 Tax=bioreactor metagenome TaxID=1076179 RepID=A0A644XFG6_9ZZZZ
MGQKTAVPVMISHGGGKGNRLQQLESEKHGVLGLAAVCRIHLVARGSDKVYACGLEL